MGSTYRQYTFNHPPESQSTQADHQNLQWGFILLSKPSLCGDVSSAALFSMFGKGEKCKVRAVWIQWSKAPNKVHQVFTSSPPACSLFVKKRIEGASREETTGPVQLSPTALLEWFTTFGLCWFWFQPPGAPNLMSSHELIPIGHQQSISLYRLAARLVHHTVGDEGRHFMDRGTNAICLSSMIGNRNCVWTVFTRRWERHCFWSKHETVSLSGLPNISL